MQRIRALLRAHLPTVVVLWAVGVAGAGVVPAPVWPAGAGATARAWGLDAAPGEGSVVAVRPLAQPLIAELPGRGGASYWGHFEAPTMRAAPDQGFGTARRGDGAERKVLGAPPQGASQALAFVVTGAERCRRFCVYRL